MTLYLIGIFVSFAFLTHVNHVLKIKPTPYNVAMNLFASMASWVIPVGFLVAYIYGVFREEDCD